MISQPGYAGPTARLSHITVANLLELSLDQQAGLDGFVNRSPNGCPLDAADFIAMVETKLGRKVRPGKRGREPHAGGWIDMGYSYHAPVMPRFQGRKRVHNADEIMSEIVAKRLVEHLERAGFVIMKRPPIGGGAALGRGFEG